MTLQLTLLLPLLVMVGIALCRRNPDARDAITLVGASVQLILMLQLYQGYMAGDSASLVWFELLPGLAMSFELEPLGVLFALIIGFLWLITSLYAIGYMRGNGESHQTRFYMLFALAISAALGIAFSANLFTLFVFYEVLTLSTFPLVTHKGNENAMKAGRVYLGILLFTSVGLLLPAIIWTWMLTGTTDFASAGILAEHLDGPLVTVLALMFLLGIGKAAVMPVHRWLPAAMVAPTPVSALLHAVAVVKAGVFCVIKVVVYVFGLELLQQAPGSEILLYLAGFTVISASVVALRQDNLKRRLAFSTIGQLSYVVLGAVMLAPISILGASLHIAAHAFGKITLFFAAGSIYTATKKTEISQLNGIGHQMPITMAAFTIGSLSMIGLPPAVGFISKWYLLMGAIEAEQQLAIVVILLSTLLNAAYFVPVIYAAYFKPADTMPAVRKEAPTVMVTALGITAAMTLLLFAFPNRLFELAEQIRLVAALS
ncbi:monovalent cation/H+ antiporter subunit D family protein [Ferrimonas marina]|uniref:Multisubunit sodium/proton antiporter, MrpD subunit n=1 Tax=Ferrimonas marina TaxID=299255 RepID=A0A1M5N7M5_9GAMM|nr:monovalent cation/H+ antiporter subunit D family protein [Ferrimonas marina]SHG85491.1 multisubunit sodium/proton antiporter, MrpD subunit [Ferrimonas marina]